MSLRWRHTRSCSARRSHQAWRASQGPASSQNTLQRLPRRRAWWTRSRSPSDPDLRGRAEAASLELVRAPPATRQRPAFRHAGAGPASPASRERGPRRAPPPDRRSAQTAARRTAASRRPRTRSRVRSPARRGTAASRVRIRDADEPPSSPGSSAYRLSLTRPRLSSFSSGIGSPCGSRVGWPSLAAIAPSSPSERTCSSTSASACTVSQPSPRLSTRYSSSSR